VGELNIMRINERGYSNCRCCTSEHLVSVLDLGIQPLPSEYGLTPDAVMDSFPLELRVCSNCGLGQLAEYVLPERIFHSSYPYLSSASSTFLDHAKKYALKMKSELSLSTNDLVIEVASNDGYLLREFSNLGVQVLGVEPASNVAGISRALGIETIANFFGEEVAGQIVSNGFKPRLIVANNVFAHVPDMNDFMRGLSTLCNDDTIITIENPSFVTLLTKGLFDTIYHEHYSYLSAHSVRAIASTCGLRLIKVETIPTHGGSNRYWLARTGKIDQTVNSILAEEANSGLFSASTWKDFAERSKLIISKTKDWLLDLNKRGNIIVGYGAAHKGNTFLNSIGEASRVLQYVVDASPEKHGKYLPGSQIPVLSPMELDKGSPSDILILPWNLANEISALVRKLCPTARIWIAQPSLTQIYPPKRLNGT
jgi:hypothetical protein